VDNPARYGFPRFARISAGLALFAGCRSEPARVDVLAVSRLKPGHVHFEDLKAMLGPPDSVSEWGAENSTIARCACWGPEYFDWIFYLRSDGTVEQFEPKRYTWTLVVIDPPGSQGGEVHEPPYKSPKPVPPEAAELFVPVFTTHSDVVAAWGPCSHASARSNGRYEVWWGSHRDFWRLEFDSDGRLYRTPRHVRY
jgi:hypothetical protein